MANRFDSNRMQAELIRLRQELTVRPIRVPIRGGAGANPYYTIQVGGGNTLTTGQAGIQYSTTAVPSAFYNPALMPAMDNGLGWGWLFTDGIIQTTPILIQHNFQGIPYSLLSGRLLRGAGTRTLSYPASGPSAQPMTFWYPDWA